VSVLVAKKVNHEDAKFPSPSSGLMRSAGRAGYICMMTNMALFFDIERTDWDNLKPRYQDIWYEIARSIYVVIALEGGATVEDIPNAEEDQQDDED